MCNQGLLCSRARYAAGIVIRWGCIVSSIDEAACCQERGMGGGDRSCGHRCGSWLDLNARELR